ncbi:hypothetical protein GCM10010129_01520 [Streptomyces fumigatiscleroticus]|nr:hypothetical protein GCM10010129_01520 [Streptomyces fumigatiscleroticus]
MTKTAERTLHTPHCDGDVLSARFDIASRSSGEEPCGEDASRPAQMRRITAARLRYWGLAEMTDDVLLIVSELVTNAVLHSAGSQVSLEMAVREGYLRIAVSGDRPGRPEARNVGDDAEAGRGLMIVALLAQEHDGAWGVDDAGATTWCDLALPKERA